MSNKITIIGLGAGDLNQIPFGVYKMMLKAELVYLRTKEHPVVAELEKEGVQFISYDDVYEKHDSFGKVYEEISESLLNKAQQQSIIYAVPGHPIVAEQTVQLLLENGPTQGIQIELAGGQSFIDAIFQALKIDPIDGFQLLDGTSLTKESLNLHQHIVIGQVYDTYVASNVKLTLMERLPDDYQIVVVSAAGSEAEQIESIPLYELDRVVKVNNLTSIYVPPVQEETILYKEFDKLREVIAELRGPNGCPWDKKQTHSSLKKYLIEEAYELIEAIGQDDIDHMIEELGDVLLQVMLHAQIGEDDGYFSINDVIESITAKMIRRHPHVFGTVEVNGVEDVLSNWNEIKTQEKSGEDDKSLLDSIGLSQPSMLRAYELQKAAAKVGFDWQEVEPVWDKVKEELQEFEAELIGKEVNENAVKEFGDLMFAMINLARFYKIHPEEALLSTNLKFTDRFKFVEKRVKESGKDFAQHSLEELDQYWDEAKELGL
ncbi:nucleoside triphosphate pyrophosphohydrolase [Bacillus marasmi]|uniref:nucleoside triphosphate pyrophosphohydrolase n=1 Tax=Bacillus marasmi TaxID=1926279 RepID=UPI0011CCC82D|nr:nucleoside triphosphate pyrophosphohydrolase [Bacillus marasmi]